MEVERVGRIGTNLSRKLRPVMYEILNKYLEIRTAAGKLYDWDDIAIAVRKEFEEDSSARFYKHIIVDEGQDFSPEMIRSLAAAIPKVNGESRNRVASINIVDGSVTSFNTDADNEVFGLLLDGTILYVGGQFTTIGRQNRNQTTDRRASCRERV